MPSTSPGVIRRNSGRRSGVRRPKPNANRPQPTAAISIITDTIDASGTTLTMEFDQPVLLNGVPQYAVDVAGASPVSAAMSDATTLVITYDADITAATSMTIPYEDPAVRNSSGGFVTPTTVGV